MNEQSSEGMLLEPGNTITPHKRATDNVSPSSQAAPHDALMQHVSGHMMQHVPRLSETLAMQLNSGKEPTSLQLKQLANRMISYDGVPTTDLVYNKASVQGCAINLACACACARVCALVCVRLCEPLCVCVCVHVCMCKPQGACCFLVLTSRCFCLWGFGASLGASQVPSAWNGCSTSTLPSPRTMQRAFAPA